MFTGTKYRKVMEWLSPVDPRQSYERILKSRTPGSGAWLTDSKDFLTWRESATNSVFWLNGITGAGKTTLMTTAIENVVAVDSKQCRTAYLYCSFANSETLEVGNILGSILAQLCNDDDTVYHKSVSLYDDRLGDKMERPIPLDVNVLVKLIAEQIQSIGNVYVFVDAINECGDVYEIAASFDTILKSLNTASRLHLFLSCINERGIENSLRQMPHLIIKTLSPRAIWNDVHLYVEANLEAHPRLRHYDPQLKAEIRRTLTGRAEGMFRYVYCQLDLLSRLRTPGAVKEALTSLPPTLDQTYERLLMRIDGEEDMRLSREILEILCFCFRPLQLKELCEFLQITPGLPMLDESKRLTDPSDVLGICGSFLNYQEDRDVVALAHHSVKTYLLSDLPPSVRYFRISKIEAHRSLAIKCLAYLSLDEFSSGPFAKLGERLRRYPLYKYAGDCWTMHSRALEQGGQQELGEPLWQVLRPFLFSAEHGRGNFLAWAQLLAPWSKNISRTGPLYYAASFGLTTVVRYLLEAGADMEAPGGRGGATPLNIASFRGRTDVVKLLLEYGADPEAADEEVGWNALEWAEAKNHWDVVVLLNRHEANKRHVDGDGNEDGSGIMSKMIQSDRRHLVTSTRNDYQD